MIPGLSGLTVLRALLLVASALAGVTLTAALGPVLPARVLPDLVLPVVVAGALLGGPSRGALLGLAAGWLVELLPPGSAVLGLTALLYAAAGLVAGAGRREGRAPFGWVPVVMAAAVGVVLAGRVVHAVVAGATFDGARGGVWAGTTVAAGAVTVPLLVQAERALRARGLR